MQGAEQYKQIEQQDDITLFVTHHSALVKRIASHLKYRLPSNIEMDDLIQSGLVGLLEARKRFSEEHNASFETYASIKIRGAMIDDFRKNSGMSREVSQHIKIISRARSKIENNTSRSQSRISFQEMADEIGVSLEKYAGMLNEVGTHQSIHVDNLIDQDGVASETAMNPSDYVETQDKISSLKELVTSLSKRDQFILALYYTEQLTFKDIAEVLDLTEARVSQIHTTLLEKIKQKWMQTNRD